MSDSNKNRMVSRYINLKVNSVYKQVDTATTDVANMWDVARFHEILAQLCVEGDIANTEKRIYDGTVVDGYEFGHCMVSQNKFQYFPVHWPNVGKCLARNKKLSRSNDIVTTQCDPVNAHRTPN